MSVSVNSQVCSVTSCSATLEPADSVCAVQQHQQLSKHHSHIHWCCLHVIKRVLQEQPGEFNPLWWDCLTHDIPLCLRHCKFLAISLHAVVPGTMQTWRIYFYKYQTLQRPLSASSNLNERDRVCWSALKDASELLWFPPHPVMTLTDNHTARICEYCVFNWLSSCKTPKREADCIWCKTGVALCKRVSNFNSGVFRDPWPFFVFVCRLLV